MNGGHFPPGFQWDEEKNQANIRKHGIDFWDAVFAFEKPTLDREDTRQDYGEDRTNSLAQVDGKVLHLTHTTRDGDIRLISARVADLGERKAYGEFLRDLPVEREPTRSFADRLLAQVQEERKQQPDRPIAKLRRQLGLDEPDL